jgi:hypothetical protein
MKTAQTQDSRNCGSHGGEYEDGCLLGCSAVQSGRSLPTIQRFLLPPSSGPLIALMMEAARTSEMLVNFYQTTRRYNSEDNHLQTEDDRFALIIRAVKRIVMKK